MKGSRSMALSRMHEQRCEPEREERELPQQRRRQRVVGV